MQPFDLEKAKQGAKLVTRDGQEAVFIAYVPEAVPSLRVLFRKGAAVQAAYEDGRVLRSTESPHDLFLADLDPVADPIFVNVYRTKNGGISTGMTHPSVQSATSGADRGDGYLGVAQLLFVAGPVLQSFCQVHGDPQGKETVGTSDPPRLLEPVHDESQAV